MTSDSLRLKAKLRERKDQSARLRRSFSRQAKRGNFIRANVEDISYGW